MGRSPCSNNEAGLKKGPWTAEEDQKLVDYIQKNGLVSWKNLPKSAGLNRCGKSCRLRWTNYLRPDIKRGKFSEEEERLIIHLHSVHGNKWSSIATHLSGRTDNEIKNYWNTNLKKKLLRMGIDPMTHRRRTELDQLGDLHALLSTNNFTNIATPWHDQHRLLADAAQLAMMQILQTLAHAMTTNGPFPTFDPKDLLRSATLPNYQINNLIQYLSYQIGSLINDSINIAQNQIPTSYGHNNIQASYEKELVSKIISSCLNGGEANQNLNSYSLLDDGSTLSLVSAASLDINLTRQDHHQPELSKSNSVSADCSNFNQFDSKNGLCDLDTDLCWKDFIGQISHDCPL